MVYQYLAVNQNGKREKGTIEGNSKEEVIKLLRNKGLYTLEIKEEKQSILKKEIEIGKVVKIEELVVFTRQLTTLIRAGVTIIDAIYILSEQTENKRLKKILKQIDSGLRNGETFSSLLAVHKKVFPTMFVNMVKAGEVAGNLDETLDGVATYLEKESNTRKKVKSALTYPIVITIFATFVTVFLMVSVVPTFVQMYADFGAELPLPTRIVIGVSQFIQNRWYLLLGFGILIVITYNLLDRNIKTKYYLDYFKLKMPVFGKLLQKAAIARFSRTLSSLLVSAVPILQALTMVSQVVNNEAIAKPIRESMDSLRQGKSLHEPLKNYSVFPPLLIHMMAIGEETGSLEEMLNKVADFYESDVEAMTDQLKALLEPMMIILLTVIIGTIIMAVLTPMFGIYNMIG
ncbi:type II secretion system protein F [Vulcanibacillus modesticaldus]|uniref:Type II secretion system protein F n=1 Tax=Vulcanibacillus modesticaldus TaxID=337097 RepID=A0A1D2YST3_9BACI|nr:type II secretion system F family protein [Vulcanibacillus modesticaldus]OEF98060.1 type II secretion system protein F [Vulcanibacillus modesticaldus]